MFLRCCLFVSFIFVSNLIYSQDDYKFALHSSIGGQHLEEGAFAPSVQVELDYQVLSRFSIGINFLSGSISELDPNEKFIEAFDRDGFGFDTWDMSVYEDGSGLSFYEGVYAEDRLTHQKSVGLLLKAHIVDTDLFRFSLGLGPVWYSYKRVDIRINGLNQGNTSLLTFVHKEDGIGSQIQSDVFFKVTSRLHLGATIQVLRPIDLTALGAMATAAVRF